MNSLLTWFLAIIAVVLVVPATADSKQVVAHFKDFGRMKQVDGAPEGWSAWSPRAEIAPKFSVDPAGGGSLKIEAQNPAQYGAWRTTIRGIRAGQNYRFTARYSTRGIKNDKRSVSARLDWLDEKGNNARPSDFVLDSGREGNWAILAHSAAAPENARSVRIELALQWAPKGAVIFDDIKLEEDSAPANRVIRAATVFHRPRNTKSPQESIESFCRQIQNQKSKIQNLDVICLPEGVSVVGTGKSYADVAESIPGPSTKRLGDLAKSLKAYVVAGIYERVGPVIYNTSVLIDRKGGLVGSYRKTHLPREEVEGGITPGDSYPVFDTDFGKVGMMICWDVQFPEPARALAAKGAEVILLPIWGGNETLAKARAIENHVFLLSSSYDMKTFIVAPDGAVLAEASQNDPLAVADLHLDRKIFQPWLGDMKPRTWKERRPDIPID